MKSVLLFVAVAAALLATAPAGRAESLLVAKNGEGLLGTVEWIHGEQVFVSCPDRIRFSLTKYKPKVVDAPGQHCHYPASADSALSADDPASQQQDEASRKAYERQRARIRKILAEYGYDVPDSDLK